VVCYESQKLNEHELNYVMNDLELAAIIHALRMSRHYLLDIRFTLMTDHIALKYLFDQPKLNVRKARWLAILSEFDFEIQFIKGKENMVTDTLSRKVQINHLTTISSYGSNLGERIIDARQYDEQYQQIKEELQQADKGEKSEEYHLTKEGLIKFKNRIYVPNNNELRRVIFKEFHANHILAIQDIRRPSQPSIFFITGLI